MVKKKKAAKKRNVATQAKPAKKRNAATKAKPAKQRSAAKKATAKKNTARKPAKKAAAPKKRNAAKKATPKKNVARKPAKKRNAAKKAAAAKKNTARRKPAKKRNAVTAPAAAPKPAVKKRKPAKKNAASKRKPAKKRNGIFNIGDGLRSRVTAAGKLKPRPKRRKRRNPDLEAPGALRAAFLGRPSDGVDVEFIAPEGTPAQLDQLAPLHSLEYQDAEGKTYVIDYDALGLTEQMVAATGHPVMLCGKRTGDGYDGLYIVNQPSLLTDEVRPGRCGELTRLRYWAVKTHLGDKEPVLYWHPMGEETGALPELALDKEGFVKIRGGEYYIPRDDFGGYSSGIHN